MWQPLLSLLVTFCCFGKLQGTQGGLRIAQLEGLANRTELSIPSTVPEVYNDVMNEVLTQVNEDSIQTLALQINSGQISTQLLGQISVVLATMPDFPLTSSKTEFEHIEYPSSARATFLQLLNEVLSAFGTAQANTYGIMQQSREITHLVGYVVRLLKSGSAQRMERILEPALSQIEELSAQPATEAKEAADEFSQVISLTSEISETCLNTKGLNEIQLRENRMRQTQLDEQRARLDNATRTAEQQMAELSDDVNRFQEELDRAWNYIQQREEDHEERIEERGRRTHELAMTRIKSQQEMAMARMKAEQQRQQQQFIMSLMAQALPMLGRIGERIISPIINKMATAQPRSSRGRGRPSMSRRRGRRSPGEIPSDLQFETPIDLQPSTTGGQGQPSGPASQPFGPAGQPFGPASQPSGPAGQPFGQPGQPSGPAGQPPNAQQGPAQIPTGSQDPSSPSNAGPAPTTADPVLAEMNAAFEQKTSALVTKVQYLEENLNTARATREEMRRTIREHERELRAILDELSGLDLRELSLEQIIEALEKMLPHLNALGDNLRRLASLFQNLEADAKILKQRAQRFRWDAEFQGGELKLQTSSDDFEAFVRTMFNLFKTTMDIDVRASAYYQVSREHYTPSLQMVPRMLVSRGPSASSLQTRLQTLSSASQEAIPRVIRQKVEQKEVQYRRKLWEIMKLAFPGSSHQVEPVRSKRFARSVAATGTHATEGLMVDRRPRYRAMLQDMPTRGLLRTLKEREEERLQAMNRAVFLLTEVLEEMRGLVPNLQQLETSEDGLVEDVGEIKTRSERVGNLLENVKIKIENAQTCSQNQVTAAVMAEGELERGFAVAQQRLNTQDILVKRAQAKVSKKRAELESTQEALRAKQAQKQALALLGVSCDLTASLGGFVLSFWNPQGARDYRVLVEQICEIIRVIDALTEDSRRLELELSALEDDFSEKERELQNLRNERSTLIQNKNRVENLIDDVQSVEIATVGVMELARTCDIASKETVRRANVFSTRAHRRLAFAEVLIPAFINLVDFVPELTQAIGDQRLQRAWADASLKDQMVQLQQAFSAPDP